MTRDRDYGMRSLLYLAWPIVISRAAQAVVGFSDAIMSAPLGEGALAAVTAGSLNVFCIGMLPTGTVFIIQSYAAQMAGRGDLAGARRYGWYGLILSLVAGLFFVVATPWVNPVVDRLSYTPQVRALMSDYIAIRMGALGVAVAVEALGNWYGGLGNTRYAMIASLATMIANVILNWLLIEGNWGAPALGVQGAAYASIAATCIGLGFLLIMFLRRTGFAGPECLELRAHEFGRMLRYGIPNGFNWFLEFAAFMFFINVVVATLGTTTTAALLAVIQVNSVSFMPAFGVASAGAILSGQAIGSGRRDAVGRILRRTLLATGAWQGTVGLLYLLAPAWLMGLFAARDVGETPAIVVVGAVLLALSAAWQLFDAAQMAFSEILRSAGDTVFSLAARLLVAWVLFVPGSYLAVQRMEGGAVAAMLAIIAYMAALSVVFALRFRSGAWKNIQLIDDGH